MTTVAMNNLWNYIEGLSLSARNRKWLAERLTNYDTKKADNVITPELQAKIDQARKDLREGRCVTLHTHEDIDAYFNSL